MAEYYSMLCVCECVCVCVYIHMSSLIPLLIDIVCIHVSAIINSAAMNIGVHVLFQIIVFSIPSPTFIICRFLVITILNDVR